MFGIFGTFRRLLEAVLALVSVLERLFEAQEQNGPAVDRLEELERSRHQFEAQCQGLLLKAEGKLKAANNAEARERQLKKFNESNTDPFGENGDEGQGEGAVVVPPLNAQAGEEERMRALRLDVAPSPKAAAIAAKWS